ncbi:MAG: hypothetical protein MPW14_15895 [Candidatus Manganitrophus sp.]|nr:MAG: hypothetical protein MPW14_15895 [Candidatus Manganitrophus sp.]
MRIGVLKRKKAVAWFFVLFILLGRSTGWGYEEGPVTDGGVLEGKVVLNGTPLPRGSFT